MVGEIRLEIRRSTTEVSESTMGLEAITFQWSQLETFCDFIETLSSVVQDPKGRN